MNLPVQTPSTTPALPGPAPLGFNVTPEQRLELLEYWRSIVKRKWLILALVLAAVVVAAGVSFALTPIYRSTATVLIEGGKGKILSIEDIYSSTGQREHYQTQVEILKSREVADRTVRALKLWEHPAFDPRQADESLAGKLADALGVGRQMTEWTEDELAKHAAKGLQAGLSVEPIRLSQLVKVNFEHRDPQLAARVANQVAAEYIESDRDARFKISQQVSGFLQERLTSLREKLTESEMALQAYRETKGIVSLAGSPQTVAGQQVGGTSERLLQARARRMELESTYQQIKSATGTDYGSVPAVVRDPAVAESLRAYNDTRRRLAEAMETLGTAHPKARQLDAELAQVSGTLAQQRVAAVASFTREYEAARATESQLERALNSARGEVQSVNREEFQLAVLEREVQTNRQLYDMFMSRAKETNLAGDVQASVARVVDTAVPGAVPVRPVKKQIVLVAAVLALFLGAMASLLLDRLDNTIKGGEDAEVRLKQPLLSALPEVTGKTRQQLARVFLDDQHSHYAEAIRTARTGVLLSSLDVPHKTLLVTSALPNEGKTTVAINLALAHAQTKKTILIDCDMRRSQVAHSMDIPAGSKGLTNLVAGSASLRECLYGVHDSRLLVLPVGDLPPNPLELLLSQKFKDTLAELSKQFEMVIIDSPPVELVSEALVLAPMATSTAFVVKAMSTPAPLVRKSLSRLQRAGANILGVMVNQLDFKRARLYYGEYTAATYNYGGYGYGGQLGYGSGGDGKKGGQDKSRSAADEAATGKA